MNEDQERTEEGPVTGDRLRAAYDALGLNPEAFDSKQRRRGKPSHSVPRRWVNALPHSLLLCALWLNQ